MSWIVFIEVIIAYLLGSIPSAVWIGQMFYGIDVRKHGSGNAGATNVIRVLGYKAGIPVLLFDVFKGWLAVQIGWWINVPGMAPDTMVYVRIAMAFAAVLGHVFPVFAGFRGGKGVGTIAGAAIALYPLAIPVVLGVFILVLATSRYVSLSSVTAAVLFPFVVIFLLNQNHPGLVILSVVVAFFIPFTHRGNIGRLLKGTEKKFDFRRKKSREENTGEAKDL
jgi:glycerol-3-phosphate acyltransferase PlsY